MSMRKLAVFAVLAGYPTGVHLLVGRQEEQLAELVAFLRSGRSG